jgi:cell division protein FtsL
MMLRLSLLLLTTLVGSSLYLVKISYDSRQLFNALDRAKNEAQQFEIDYARLKAEHQSQATPLRVERVARDKLAMRVVNPTVTQYVSDMGPASQHTTTRAQP